jgi:hypothetical protein
VERVVADANPVCHACRRTYNLVPASLSRDKDLLDTSSGSAIFDSRNLNPRSSKRCLSEMRTINVRRPGASARILCSAANLAARRNVEGSANCSATSSPGGMSLIPLISISSTKVYCGSTSGGFGASLRLAYVRRARRALISRIGTAWVGRRRRTRNSSTSREILRRVAADSLKTLAVAANVGHLLLRRILRRAMRLRYRAARGPVKRIGQDTALS